MNIVNFEDVFSIMRYPAGESHVEMRSEYAHRNGEFWVGMTVIASNVRCFEDLGNVISAQDIFTHKGAKWVTWFIPYFPFGRHDRRRFTGDGMELTVALDMIFNMDVVTLDPHSEAMGATNMRYIPQKEFVDYCTLSTGLFLDNPIIVVPDQGATKKAMTWIRGREWAQGTKHRNTSSGNLDEFGVNIEEFAGSSCIIVDDICDGGGTFIGLAKILKKRNAGSLTLAVTHGLFTRGVKHLFDVFDHIITTGPVNLEHKGVITISHEIIYRRGIQL